MLEVFRTRGETGRADSLEDATRIHEELIRTYDEYGYRVVAINTQDLDLRFSEALKIHDLVISEEVITEVFSEK